MNLKSRVDSSEDDHALNKKGREKKDHGFCDYLDEKRRATYKQHISVYLFLVFPPSGVWLWLQEEVLAKVRTYWESRDQAVFSQTHTNDDTAFG